MDDIEIMVKVDCDCVEMGDKETRKCERCHGTGRVEGVIKLDSLVILLQRTMNKRGRAMVTAIWPNVEKEKEPEESDCPGEGKCHGPVNFCPECGEVDDVCDDPNCDLHDQERARRNSGRGA